MWYIAALFGTVIILIGLASLIYPIKELKIQNRQIALIVFLVGLIVLFISMDNI